MEKEEEFDELIHFIKEGDPVSSHREMDTPQKPLDKPILNSQVIFIGLIKQKRKVYPPKNSKSGLKF